MTALDVTATQSKIKDRYVLFMPPDRVMIQKDHTITHYWNVPTRFVRLLTDIIEFYSMQPWRREPIGDVYPRKNGWSYRGWL